MPTHVVSSARDLPEPLFEGDDIGPQNTRVRLLALERDSRFATSYICVTDRDTVLAALPLYETNIPFWPDLAYDVGNIFATEGMPKDWMLIGGRADLHSGILLVGGLPDPVAERAVGQSVAAAACVAVSRGRRPAILYASDLLLDAALRVGVCKEISLGNRAVIEDTGSDLSSYLKTLPRRRVQKQVRPDLKLIENVGVAATEVRWEEIIEDVAPLIVQVSARHGKSDHPLLVAQRLTQWADNPDVCCVGFAVQQGGELYGASLALVFRDTLYIYEVGLGAENSRLRRTVYLELMFYAPLRFAWRAGVRKIDLGLKAEQAKARRGAALIPVYGIEVCSEPWVPAHR